MAEVADPNLIMLKQNAIGALFPYALRLEQGGSRWMVEALTLIARVVKFERFVWHHIELDKVFALASPHVPWGDGPHDEIAVSKWALAASVVPYTEEVGRRVVDVLLHTASVDSLRPSIPVGTWAWLKKRPSLPSRCSARSKGSSGDIVRQVRALGDVETLTSYMLLIWSEWDCVDSSEQGSAGGRSGLAEMRISIQEDFSGVRMGRYREDLIIRLDHVLEQLGRGLEYLEKHKPGVDEDYIQMAKEQYEGLRKVLLEVDGEAANTLARTSPWVHSSRSTDVHVCAQNPIRPSCALYRSRVHDFAFQLSTSSAHQLPSSLLSISTHSRTCHIRTTLIPGRTHTTQPSGRTTDHERFFAAPWTPHFP